MVLIALPPPNRAPYPLFYTVRTGTRLVRIFDPTSPWQVSALTFNHNGPRNRFDHHRPAPPGSVLPFADDPDRGIYYAGSTLSCCIAECFGDHRMIDKPHLNVAYPMVQRRLRLLDLCRDGAMRVGSVSALCGTADRAISQAWSRYFYEHPVFQNCDGVRYHSAHNNEPAVALYERAETALVCPNNQVIALADPLLRPELLTIAGRQNLTVLI
jgi:hypothetical protein